VRLRLESVLSWAGLATAVAYCLGWLKTLYYYDTFGIGLSSLGLSPADYLFESWFVLENVFFFFLVAWIAVNGRRPWLWAVGVAYSLIPILSHYAFLRPDAPVSEALINYRHTILKATPFVMLIVVAALDVARKRPPLKSANDLRWSFGQGALALFVLVVAAWSISVAKHFGSFDANRAMLRPDSYFARVSLTMKASQASAAPPDAPASTELYLVYANDRQLFVWDRAGFVFDRPRDTVRLLVIPRDEVSLIRMQKPHEVQPGALFF
jgi:hypothetical protein